MEKLMLKKGLVNIVQKKENLQKFETFRQCTEPQKEVEEEE